MLSITPEDISKGRRKQPNACPISIAIRRVTGFEYAGVTGDTVLLGKDPGNAKRLPLPESARHFVNAYDAGDKVKPLELPWKLRKWTVEIDNLPTELTVCVTDTTVDVTLRCYDAQDFHIQAPLNRLSLIGLLLTDIYKVKMGDWLALYNWVNRGPA